MKIRLKEILFQFGGHLGSAPFFFLIMHVMQGRMVQLKKPGMTASPKSTRDCDIGFA